MRFEPKKYPNMVNVALLMSLGYKVDSISESASKGPNSAHITLVKKGALNRETFEFKPNKMVVLPLFANNFESNVGYSIKTIKLLNEDLQENKEDYMDETKLHLEGLALDFADFDLSNRDKLANYLDKVEVVLSVLKKKSDISLKRSGAILSLTTAMLQYKNEAELESSKKATGYLANFNNKYGHQSVREDNMRGFQNTIDAIFDGEFIKQRENNGLTL